MSACSPTADSATPPTADGAPPAPATIGVAFSGGHDSTALLHATAHAALPLGLQVLALHVHHGLSAHADHWLGHAQALCKRWASRGLPVTLVFRRLAGKPPAGASTEAWAREGRYRALTDMAREQQVSLVLLAQHRRDQAETLLLQALRGGGVAGLSAMPRTQRREGVVFARPWLATPHAEIATYVRRHRLRHVDDDSNADERFARNRLRLSVWPALMEAFPDAEGCLADSARRIAGAALALEECAAADLSACADPHGLRIAAWRALPAGRRMLALRHWLAAQTGQHPAAALSERLLDELSTATSARWPAPGGELRLYRGALCWSPGLAEPAVGPCTQLSIRRAGRYAVPGWDGLLRVTRVADGGVPLERLAHIDLRPRAGGERFQAGANRPARSLKKQYQACAVPAGARNGPLAFSAGELVYVPGLGIDARVQAPPGTPQVALEWIPRPD